MTIRMQFYGTLINAARKHWLSVQKEKAILAELFNEWKLLDGDEREVFWHDRIRPIKNNIDEKCIIVIVLCASGLEGYIYDYAARKLSDRFVEHLDRLDAVSKWVIIPQLITGKKFPKSERAFQLLKQLVADRNYLVHPKSAKFIEFDKNNNKSITQKAKRMQDFSNSLYEKAKNAILAIDQLALAIEKIDPEEHASFHLGAMVGKRKQQLDEYRT